MGRRTELGAAIGATADFLNKYQFDALSRMSQVTQEGQAGGNSVGEKRVDLVYNDIGQFTQISRFFDLGACRNSRGREPLRIAKVNERGSWATDSLFRTNQRQDCADCHGNQHSWDLAAGSPIIR